MVLHIKIYIIIINMRYLSLKFTLNILKIINLKFNYLISYLYHNIKKIKNKQSDF